MANQYSEMLLSGIDTVIQGRLKDLKYDQTIECLVTDVTKKKDRIYRVKTQNAEFEAYATTSDTYYKNDTVYVMIPQGDYTKQKFITGRKVDPVATTNTYSMKLPFDDFIGLQQVQNDQEDKESYGFWANYYKDDTTVNRLFSYRKNITTDDGASAQQIVDLVGTKLGIEMDVQSLLGQHRPVSGDYGLRVTITGEVQEQRSKPQSRTVIGYFSKEDMYGNAYAFYSPYHQQKIFDISEFMSITAIDIDFWQDENFIDEGGRRIPFATTNNRVTEFTNTSELDSVTDAEFDPPNLIISGINVFLGLTTDEIDDEKAFLFSHDNLQYGEDSLSEANRSTLDTRTLKFVWVHKTAENNFCLVNNNDSNESDKYSTSLQKVNRDIQDLNAHIYWYKKTNQDTTTNVGPGHFGGFGWEYLSEFDDQFECTQIMDISKSREQFKVVVAFYNTYVTSDVLEFANIIDIDSVNENQAANNEVVFRFFTEKDVIRDRVPDENGNYNYYSSEYGEQWVNGEKKNVKLTGFDDSPRVKVREIVEDSTVGNFFCYDETNRCLKDADEVYWYTKWFYVQIWVKSRDENGEEYYIPIPVDEVDGKNATWDIQWITPELPPIGYTMIRDFTTIDSEDAEKLNVLTGTGKSGRALANLITRKFRIANVYNELYHDNTLRALVSRNGREYRLSKELQFGIASSGGSEYTVVINQTLPEAYTAVQGQLFALEALVYDRMNQLSDSSNYRFTWELVGPSKISTTKEGTIDETWVQLDSDSHAYIGNKITGYVRNNYPPVFKVTVTGAASYDISAIRGLTMVTDTDTMNTYVAMVPNRIEYKSDGKLPILDTSNFLVRNQATGEEVFPKWILKEFQLTTDKQWKDNSGNASLDLIPVTTAAQSYGTNSAQGLKREAVIRYHLALPSGRDNWYWEDGKDTGTYIYIYFIEDGKQVAVPIAIAHNAYSSTLINQWDGTFNIDKQNNVLMSRMLSAGTKDSQNRFSGVMLGDWEDNADKSVGTGLWGINKGEQTFGLRTDGTGFIGKASNGQITFDGNNALISDAAKDFYINLNPLRYNLLTDGSVNIQKSATSFSPYFLYAKSAHTSETSSTAWLDKADTVDAQTQWTNQYLNDTANDYFIVDPNNGVLLSGGIVSRYGKIGNWRISDQGLYQKTKQSQSDGTTKEYYMYLGYNAVSDEVLKNTALTDNTKSQLDSDKVSTIGELESHIANLSTRETDELARIQDEYQDKLMQEYATYLQENGMTSNIFKYDPKHYMNYGDGLKMAAQLIRSWLAENPTESARKDCINYVLSNINYVFSDEQLNKPFHNHYNTDGSLDSQYLNNYYTGGLITVGYVFGRSISIPYAYKSVDNSSKQTRYYKSHTVATSENTATTRSNALDNTYYSQNSVTEHKDLVLSSTVLKTIYSVAESRAEYLKYCEYLEGIYEEYLAAYNQQIEDSKKEAGTAIPQSIRDEIASQQAAALEAAKNKYAQLRETYSKLLTEEKNLVLQSAANRYAIFAGDNEFENPLFSVNWQGTMTARRGEIGYVNPWVISDNGLTQTAEIDLTNKKNYATIFLGNGEVDTLKVSDKYTIKNVSASPFDKDTHYSILAAEDDTINFGVTRKGYLFSRAGKMGGWVINDHEIRTDTDEGFIILDSTTGTLNFNNATIIGSDGSLILGAKGSDGDTIGSIAIAGFNFIGSTKEEINLPQAATLKTKVGNNDVSSSEYTFWGQTAVSIGAILSYNTGEFTYNNDTVISKNRLAIMDSTTSGQNQAGIIIATGVVQKENENDKNVLAFLPSQYAENAILGADKRRWDLYADVINCKDLQLENGNINAQSIYMQNNLVATEEWVTKQLNKVYNAIKSAAGGSSGGSGRAFGAAGGLASGLNNRTAALEEFLIGKKFFKNLLWKTSEGAARLEVTYEVVTGSEGGKAVVGETTDTVATAASFGLSLEEGKQGPAIQSGWINASSTEAVGTSINHYLIKEISNPTLSVSGTDLYVGGVSLTPINGDAIKMPTTATKVSINHTHSITLTASNGKIEVSAGTANFSNLATTKDSLNITQKSLSWASDNKSVDISIQAGNTEIFSKTISATPAYNEGYSAGRASVDITMGRSSKSLGYTSEGSYDFTISSNGSTTFYITAAAAGKHKQYKIKVTTNVPTTTA